jgi:hypothetical protein
VNIAIIGTGNIGATLIRRLAAAGHHVAVANSRGPDSLRSLATETGAEPCPLAEVARDAQVVIVSIPPKAVAQLPSDLLAAGRPDAFVIDTGNYVPRMRDGVIEALEHGAVESRWTESHVGRPVVKAFNTIKAVDLRDRNTPQGGADRVALPVAGDDPAAKAITRQLINEVGFDSIDAGGLDDSWRQQPGTPVYTTNLTAAEALTAIASATPEQNLVWRSRMVSGASTHAMPSHP